MKSSANELFEVTINYTDKTERFVAPFDILENIQLSQDQGCVEIRARDVSGRVSEPATHCFESSSFPVLQDAETDGTFIDCASEEIQELFDANSNENSGHQNGDTTEAHEDTRDQDTDTLLNSEPLKGIDERERASDAIACSMGSVGRDSLTGAPWLLALSLLALRQRRTRREL